MFRAPIDNRQLFVSEGATLSGRNFLKLTKVILLHGLMLIHVLLLPVTGD